MEGTPSHDRPTEDDENITTAEQARRILERLSDVDRTWALHRARVNASRGHVSSPRSQPPADDAGATDRLLIDAARLAIRRRTA